MFRKDETTYPLPASLHVSLYKNSDVESVWKNIGEEQYSKYVSISSVIDEALACQHSERTADVNDGIMNRQVTTQGCSRLFIVKGTNY